MLGFRRLYWDRDLRVANSRVNPPCPPAGGNEGAGASTTILNRDFTRFSGLLGLFIERDFRGFGIFFTEASALAVVAAVMGQVAELAKGFEVFVAVVGCVAV